MKSAPRQNGSPFIALLAACGVLVACIAPVLAQSAARESAPRTPSKESRQTPARKNGAKARERRERQQAVAALFEVADAAHSLEDLDARAEVLLLAAAALWPADAPAARAIFRRAWETATAADLADTKRRAEELRAKRPEGSAVSVAETTRARYGALAAVARRDPRMAETLLTELKPTPTDESDDEERGTSEPVADERANPRRAGGERGLSPRGRQRLMVAWDLLLDHGEPLRAAQLAAPLVAEGPVREFVRFILQLRPHAQREADALYLQLLGRTASDSTADANDVLVLSSYIVSPRVFITVSGEGSVGLYAMGPETGEDVEGRDVPLAVRRAFYDVAAALLLRPSPARATEPEVLAESAARFFAAGRLLPFFERDAPQYAPQLRERIDALASGIEEARRERLSAHMRTESLSRKNPSDPLEKYLKEMSDPVKRAERMGLRLRAVAEAARLKLWDRARNLAADIADADARRVASTLIACYQIKHLSEAYADDDDENDFERAARFAREADVPPSVHARGLAQAAEMAERKGKRARALELLEEAVSFALRAEKGSDQRLDAILTLAAIAARLDPARAWELLPEVVRTSNAADAPEGEATPRAASAATISQIVSDNGDELEKIFEPFRPEELFATMARGDFARALAEAKALEDGVTRASSIIAASRAVIERSAKSQGSTAR